MSGSIHKEASFEFTIIKKLLTADWGYRRDQPLTSDELLVIGRSAFEPLFDAPPIGPIPAHLAAYNSVHGCVAEYEDQLEELDRWKALELSRWLKERVGKTWCVAGKVYQLQAQHSLDDASDLFRFRGIGDQGGYGS